MGDLRIGDSADFPFPTSDPDGFAGMDPDSSLFRVRASGESSALFQGAPTDLDGDGSWSAIFEITDTGPDPVFIVGTIYHVDAQATIGEDSTPWVPIGTFRVQAAGATVGPTLEETTETLADAHGAGAWGYSAGGGTSTLEATVLDGDGAGIGGQLGTIWNVTMTGKLVDRVVSDALGVLRTLAGGLPGLPDGIILIVMEENAAFSYANPYPVTIDGPTTGTVVAQAISLPAATDPDMCAVWEDIIGLDGELVGAREGRLVVAERLSPDFIAAGHLARDREDDDLGWTSASGRAVLELVHGLECRLELHSPEGVREYTIIVPAEMDARVQDLV